MTEADNEKFAEMIAEAMGGTPNARDVAKADGRCPCGSGQYGYNLFDTKGKLLLYCCHKCEKPRRALLIEGGERLTKEG